MIPAEESTPSSRVAATDADQHAQPAALVAEPDRPRAVELDLGERRRSAARAVSLSRMQLPGVAVAVREHPGHEEAGQSAGGLREREEDVAHRRGAEPLLPGQPVGLAVLERAAGLRGGHRRAWCAGRVPP